MFARVVLAAAVMAAPMIARADEWRPVSGPRDDEPDVGAGRRGLAVTLSIVPGAITRGVGSRIVGEPATGRRLLKYFGLGLGIAAAGGIPVGLTYGNDKTIVPGVHLLVAGAGIAVASWWSDVYVAAGGRRLHGEPRALPPLAVGLSTTWQHDGYRGERFYLTPNLAARRGRWAVAGSAFVTDDASSFGGRAELAARLWGRFAGERTARARHDATFVEARTALQGVRERDDGFTLGTVELELRGRVELALVDRNLRGTFFEVGEGLGVETATYAVGGTDVTALLLSRFAWGLYLPGQRGEVSAFYDHRRDQLAGGLPAGRAAGFFGSVGVTGDVVVTRGLAVVAQLEVGSAWITTVGVTQELP